MLLLPIFAKNSPLYIQSLISTCVKGKNMELLTFRINEKYDYNKCEKCGKAITCYSSAINIYLNVVILFCC